MIGALLGAGVAGLQAILQAQAQADQNAINWRAVMETQRANREKEKLMKATRGDAYGNKLEYRDGQGFMYDLTPITKAILGGEQNEQYLGLKKDAPRNRQAAERMDERSRLADAEFTKKFNEYRYAPRKNENDEVTEATDTLLRSRQKGKDEAAALFAQQLLRTGGSSSLASIFKKVGDNFGDTLSTALSEGKRLGRNNYEQAETGRIQRQNAELGQLAGLANQTTTSPVDPGTYNRDLSGRADSAVSQLAQILSHNQGAITNALQTYGQGVGQSVDLGGLAAALSKLGEGMNSQQGIADGGPGPKNPNSGRAWENEDDPWGGLRTATL